MTIMKSASQQQQQSSSSPKKSQQDDGAAEEAPAGRSLAGSNDVLPTVIRDQELFPIGMLVRVKTKFEAALEGEVLSFDWAMKLLVLKTKPKSQMSFINLNCVEHVERLRDPVASFRPPALQAAALDKSKKRFDEAMKLKKRSLLKVPVTTEGQRVFLAIRKTMPQLEWQDDTVVVMDVVTVPPPYKVAGQLTSAQEEDDASLQGKKNPVVAHVQKILDKFWREYKPSSCAGEPTANALPTKSEDESGGSSGGVQEATNTNTNSSGNEETPSSAESASAESDRNTAHDGSAANISTRRPSYTATGGEQLASSEAV